MKEGQRKHADDTLGSSSWVVKKAPYPNEIYWENFGLDANEKEVNKIKSVSATLRCV
jgi:hypothetical protein